MDDAAAAGYTVLSLSGGEPLMYSPLGRLLRHGRRHGMLTAVTTNGMLLDERHLADLAGAVDLIAVSLDGVPDSHNRMRASDRAFDSMAGKLPKVRDSGIPFGFIFTLTQHNVAELEWVARFAVEQGAALLQIHPLEEVGRAFELLRGSHPDDMQSAYAFLEALRIQGAYEDRITVQLDLVDVEVLRDHPGRVFAHDGEPPQDARLAELVAPLIVEADATVVPLQYGFDRRYALGSLADHPLRELGERWVRTAYAGFRALCRQVFEEITAPDEDALPFVNWYEIVGLRAQAYGREARLEPGPA